MKTLKKNNISQGSSINSPVPVNKNCDLPPFFNPDYFGHVVVQTIQELYSIPCKLRQDGMVATVVQDNYTDYQLQSSKLNKGVCDNTTWIKVESSGTGGGNLLIFGTMTEANDYISFNHFLKEGQIFYIVENEEYYKYDGQDGLVDPFPYKLEKPSNNGLDNSNYKIPAYLDNQPYWISPSNFGKVKSVNGKEGDVILKTSDLENDSDYTTNATLTAHTSNKSNPHNVTKEQIGLGNVDNTSDLNKPISTATQIELNKKINKPTTNNTPDYVLLADGSTAPKSDFGKVDKVMGVAPDNNKNVDISSVATNWTNASQRFSGLVDKSADATYNLFPVFDSNKNLAYADNPYQLFKKGFGLLTAQQSLELGHLLNGGQGSAGAMSVNLISPPFIQNFYNSIEYLVLRGVNLYLNSESMGVEILASDKTTIVASIPNSQIQLNSNGTELMFYYNFHNFPLGTYYIKLISGSRIYISTISFGVKEKVDEVNVNSIVWEKTERNDIAISTNNMASSGDFTIATDDVDQNTPLPIISFKSNELFPEGQDFMIDMELTFSNTTWGKSSNASKASIGIGYSVDTNELSYRNVADVKMLCFQSIGIDIKNDNTTVYYDAGPVTFRFTIVKTGNLIRQTLGSHTTTKIINNNSGYSIFLQMPGFDKSTYIQGRILKLYKF